MRKALQVTRHHLQLEGAGAADVVAGHHLGHLADRVFELARGFVGDALGVHAHEGEHAQPDLVAVDLGAVALDEAGIFQRPHAAPARRRRQAHALRQLGVREAAIGLQFLQDSEVELVNAFHRGGC
ncbi:hypothetical protein D3C72_1868300 [compost metagenome]